MKEKIKLRMILIFTIGYLLIFAFLALLNKNYEFLYYTVIMSIIILIAVFHHKKLHLPTSVLSGFALFGMLQMAGGNVFIKSTRLFDTWVIPSILKYDQMLHFIVMFFITITVYSLLYPYLDKKIKQNKNLLFLLLILIALGIGTLNEILELGAVVFLNAGERVGDYMNNALDLVFNLLGSIGACFFLTIHYKKKEKLVLEK